MPEALIHALHQAYGLKVDRVERIDYGIWEENFTVETDRGRLFAKRFRRKDRKLERMVAGLQLSQRLRAAGFPAPAVIPTVDGELLALVEGERYQVNEWLEGRSYHPCELPLQAAGPMGAVLGRLHRMLGPSPVEPPAPFPSPGEAIRECRALLERYEGRAEPFAETARAVLAEQIELLESLPDDFGRSLAPSRLGGPCFHSFWVEQLLFRPDGQVAALVDWTDGAGMPATWAEDIDTGLHLSALDEDGVAAFVAGYQSEHPLPESEWRALTATFTYGHLASTNFLAGWLSQPYRRMADWEVIATRWHTAIPDRFRRREEWEELILNAARGAG